MRFGFWRWVRFSCLVDSDHPELIPLAFAETRYPCFQLINGGHTVLVVSDECIKPSSELVLLLDDVVGDGSASIVLGLLPAQCDGLVVKVNNLWFTRLTGRS